jgi:hypothetical protein
LPRPGWVERLASFLVRDVGCESQFFIGLGEQIFCSLCMSAELILVIALSGVNFLIRLNDGDLSSSEVSVPPVDIDDRGLREGDADAGYDYADCDGDDQDFAFHFYSPIYSISV